MGEVSRAVSSTLELETVLATIVSRAVQLSESYAGIAYANAALQASVLAMQSVLKHLKKHGSLAGAEAEVMPFTERQKLVDHQGYIELEKRYATR